jgi:hypothetical protein
MDKVKFGTVSWEEIASAFPHQAQDMERLMLAVYSRFQYEKADVSDVTTIVADYFRRARWPRPTNLAATANHCASKGWLSEVGRTERRKMWRITHKGYDHVESILGSPKVQEKEHEK